MAQGGQMPLKSRCDVCVCGWVDEALILVQILLNCSTDAIQDRLNWSFAACQARPLSNQADLGRISQTGLRKRGYYCTST